jgi:hypothetical protein
VALALASAHRQGVVHRDVKPANILFDEEGNAYLSDFGIAKDLAAAELGGRGGTPSPLAAYLSPEEARGESVTPKADIYGLGVVAFEALAGRHPFAGTPADGLIDRHAREPLPSLRALRPDLPRAIDDVIACATAKVPAERPGDAVALATALRGALAPATRPLPARVPPLAARNPYKGLRPFLEADAADFFGRDRMVDELVTRIGEPEDAARFLAVVGPSGSGKSSLVRAGLVPAVRRGAVPGSEGWYVVEMHPGAHPFEELAAALTRIAVTPLTGLVERLQQDGAGLFRVAADILLAGPAQLLVVIDQFEEVFTLVDDEDWRARFLSALATAATDPRSRVRVVVTLRADLYDRPLSHPGIAELMKTRTAAVTPRCPGTWSARSQARPRRWASASTRRSWPPSWPRSPTSRRPCRCCSTHSLSCSSGAMAGVSRWTPTTRSAASRARWRAGRRTSTAGSPRRARRPPVSSSSG